jgi:hypothetical protein
MVPKPPLHAGSRRGPIGYRPPKLPPAPLIAVPPEPEAEVEPSKAELDEDGKFFTLERVAKMIAFLAAPFWYPIYFMLA